jgi:acyl-CoA thioester hydrolase
MDTSVFKHKANVQVRFSDVDMLGHVSNTVYQTYFDYGKLSYFDVVLGEIDWEEIAVVGASIRIEYLKPIFLKSKIFVETRVSLVGTKSLTIEHRIISQPMCEILSTCTAVLVCYSPKLQKSIPLPDEWRRRIKEYEPDVVFK